MKLLHFLHYDISRVTFTNLELFTVSDNKSDNTLLPLVIQTPGTTGMSKYLGNCLFLGLEIPE